jgi:uncharacterized Zn-binding protein involved in type VI secretion
MLCRLHVPDVPDVPDVPGKLCTAMAEVAFQRHPGRRQPERPSITRHPGQTLLVTLGSTYWTIQGSSNSLVLAPVGAAVTSPQPFSAPPGSGCGTVSQEFRADKYGTAQVTASRVSCGEAMGCVGPTGQYQLPVQGTAAASSDMLS